MTPGSGAVRFHTPSLPQKLTRIFATGGGGDSNTCHRDNVVTWQRRLRLLSIQTLNCFYWAEYWLLWKKWWHAVIIGIKHDCVCIVGVKLPRVLSRHSGCALVIARRGETTPSGVWHQQYTHNHVWSLKSICKVLLNTIVNKLYTVECTPWIMHTYRLCCEIWPDFTNFFWDYFIDIGTIKVTYVSMVYCKTMVSLLLVNMV